MALNIFLLEKIWKCYTHTQKKKKKKKKKKVTQY